MFVQYRLVKNITTVTKMDVRHGVNNMGRETAIAKYTVPMVMTQVGSLDKMHNSKEMAYHSGQIDCTGILLHGEGSNFLLLINTYSRYGFVFCYGLNCISPKVVY